MYKTYECHFSHVHTAKSIYSTRVQVSAARSSPSNDDANARSRICRSMRQSMRRCVSTGTTAAAVVTSSVLRSSGDASRATTTAMLMRSVNMMGTSSTTTTPTPALRSRSVTTSPTGNAFGNVAVVASAFGGPRTAFATTPFGAAKTTRGFASDATRSKSADEAEEDVDDDEDDENVGLFDGNADASTSSSLSTGVMRVRWNIAETQGLGADATTPVFGYDGETKGEVALPGRIFDAPLRVDIVHRVVRWQRARARSGLHKTKTRGEVSGTTRKARPQKGQGRARVGNLKAPQMRGGGVAHGPVVRSHAHDLPKKVRRMGLKVALSARAAEGKLVVVDSFEGIEPKTRAMRDALERLTGDIGLAAGGKYHSALIVDGEFEPTTADDEDSDSDSDSDAAETPMTTAVRLASRNLPHVQVLPQVGLNVYSILRHRTLIITKSGLEQLIARLDAPIKR
jgi:large subunit ribosomal protein L4